MSGCGCEGYESQFGAQHAAKDLKRYRAKGPDKTTRQLLDALREHGVQGASVLDIGAGIGAVHHELLSSGARSATHVDVTGAHIRAAQEEATRQGHTGQVKFVQGDFVAVAADVPPADIVTLDRVICCYPDMERLVSLSAKKAGRLYGAVYPRERWFVKAFVALGNRMRQIRGNAFRSYVHSVDAIDAALERQGLGKRNVRETFVWRVVVYSR